MTRWGKETRVKFVGGEVIFRFSEPGFDDWARAVSDIVDGAEDLTEVFDWFGNYMVNGSFQRNFDAGGRPSRWSPLSEPYATQKRRRYGSRPILEASGAMRGGFRWSAHPRSLQIRNLRRYFSYHQEGRGLPQRMVMVIQNQDKGWFTRRLKRHLVDRTAVQRQVFGG